MFCTRNGNIKSDQKNCNKIVQPTVLWNHICVLFTVAWSSKFCNWLSAGSWWWTWFWCGIFSDEAWLYLNGHVNICIIRYWSRENPHLIYEVALHDAKLVFCAELIHSEGYVKSADFIQLYCSCWSNRKSANWHNYLHTWERPCSSTSTK